MRFLDILMVLRLDLGQISFNLVENAFATRQLALLATKITFYNLLHAQQSRIFFSRSLLLVFISFCCSDWPFTGLACVGKTFKKESSSGPIFSIEQLGVVAGNFALSFSLIFLSIFVHTS